MTSCAATYSRRGSTGRERVPEGHVGERLFWALVTGADVTILDRSQ